MSATFTRPIRAQTTVAEEQVLLVGVIDETYGVGEAIHSSVKLLACHANGELTLMDISDVVLNFRHDPISGWDDITPEGETEPEPREPVDEDDDDT